MFVIPQSIQYDENTTTYQLSILFADRLNETLDNEVDAISDMSLTARLFLSEIKRGTLQDYFDITLPQQGQPFLERFNDNVAGVALDANIIVYEDVNACPQYPTPTPSNTPDLTPTITPTNTPTNTVTPSITPTISLTPSITPTNTITPTVTPSIDATVTPTVTPTLTPTPSSTPTIFTPATLNALWWIDFTDASTLTTTAFVPPEIITATDKINSVVFSADPGGPLYFPTGYNSVSGSVRTNATQLKNQSGEYSNVGEYTWFGTVYDDTVSQRGGKIFVAAQEPGWPGGQAFSLIADPNLPPSVWRFQNRTQTGSNVQLTTDITYSAWTLVAMRSYNSGGNVVFEVWENNNIIDSGTAPSSNVYVSTDPIFGLLFDGGIDFSTEQFFFDRKLTDTEMTQMYNYISNKY
jgi:hypothetical protein